MNKIFKNSLLGNLKIPPKRVVIFYVQVKILYPVSVNKETL